jgi:hypothetical protein
MPRTGRKHAASFRKPDSGRLWRRWIPVTALVLAGFCTARRVDAQATPTATRGFAQVGGGFSFGSTDYVQPYIKGYSIFGDYTVHNRLSVEAEFHDQEIGTPDDIGEKSALAGLRYSFSIEGRAMLYAKVLGGLGTFTFQPPRPNAGSSSYGAFAFGGGIEFRAAQHINIRAIDLEFQRWPGYPPSGLTPVTATIGAAYLF